MRIGALALTPLLLAAAIVGPARAEDLKLDKLANDVEGAAFFSPFDNLDAKILAALDQAKPGSTVYMSYYSLSYAEYPKMFAKLKARGVNVRLNLFEGVNVQASYTIDDDLIAAGFDVELIPNLRAPDGFSSMHTKFTVVNDELVLTGSANLSASASLANHEHIVAVKNTQLAKEYITEWNEERTAAAVMREAMPEADRHSIYDNDKLPDSWTPAKATALANKLATIDRPTAQPLTVVRTYFSPDDQCESVVRAELLKAKKSVRVSMYQLASGRLAGTLASLAKKGIDVTLICDEHQQSSEASKFADEILVGEPRLRYVKAKNTLGNTSLQHQKYAIIDDRTVIGGSFNWTAMANKYNDENLIVMQSRKLADKFRQDFAGQLAAYDPEGEALDPQVDGATSKVLFCVAVPFEVPEGFVVVVTGDTPELGSDDPKKGFALRTSRSTAPNWLGAVEIARGKHVKWRASLVKKGSIVGALGDDPNAIVHLEKDARELDVSDVGVASIVKSEWTGPSPFAP
ncbi:MAG: phospholipase D-like domain-containing protein [Planctomycetota bacterium]